MSTLKIKTKTIKFIMENKEKIASAIMAGAKLAKEGKPIPYLEGEEEDLDFDEGSPKKEKDDEIAKAFKILLGDG